MASFYDEIEIEDMVFDEARDAYFYPCPCGDKFVITVVRVCICIISSVPLSICVATAALPRLAILNLRTIICNPFTCIRKSSLLAKRLQPALRVASSFV